MNLDQITTKCWILALIIRDDGERLLLGDGWFDFKDSLQHFQPNSIANDIVELQGTDGQLLAGQVRRSASQSFDGYVGDALTSKTEIENRRRQFIQFFRTRRHYKVIYIFPDGTAIQRRMGYLTDAPSVPEMWQKFPEYHVALNFEDVNYYEYAEDAQGDEIYAHESLVKLISVQSGGLVWDEDGAVSHGYTWLNPQTVTGDYVTVTDGATGSPLTLSQLKGNATQDGTPTPDAPVSISTVIGEQVVKVVGKNLFDVNSVVNLAPTTVITSNANYRGFYIKANAGDAYTLSRASTSAPQRFRLIFTKEKPANGVDFWSVGGVQGSIPNTDDQTTISFTVPAGMNYIFLYLANNGSTIDETAQIQLELGTTTTAYEPYQEQSFTIDLGSIELAKIGTYQDRIYKNDGKWYIEKQVGKVVLDGTEAGWGLFSNNNAFYSRAYDAQKPSSTATAGAIMANYYTAESEVNIYNAGVDYGIGISSQNRLLIRNKDIATVANLKTWLGTNKPSVYYALATPTTTEITDETLLLQLNFLASLYERENNISLVGTGAQGEMTLNYYADVDTTGAGYEWESGEGGGPTIVQAIGVDDAQPIWTVTGPATNPTLTNITTVQTITWNGTVPNGQKLIVDMANQTATLAGANVYEFITGSWLTLRPGANKLTYSAQGADQASQIQWNGVVG